MAQTCDVLTSALGNAYTALYVSIYSPHAVELVRTCTQTTVEATFGHRSSHLPALQRQSIDYTPIVWSACGWYRETLTPIVWSAYGQPHGETLTVLRTLSKSIACTETHRSTDPLMLTRR